MTAVNAGRAPAVLKFGGELLEDPARMNAVVASIAGIVKAATLPCTSEKCVRSDGVLPAPDTPDFASTTMSVPGLTRPALMSGRSGRSVAVG